MMVFQLTLVASSLRSPPAVSQTGRPRRAPATEGAGPLHFLGRQPLHIPLLPEARQISEEQTMLDNK